MLFRSSDADAVRAWLTSFGGAIATANYADEMIEAGYDSLDNMIFSADTLQDQCPSVKPGHAARIARDAVQMMQGIGSITGGDTPTESPPTVGASIALGAADAMKIAGASPPFPSGAGKHLPRARVEEWLDRMIVWCRIWSPAMADALVFRRDQPGIGIEGARVR